MKTRFGALGEDALHRAPRPLLVARQLRQRLRPVRDDLVGAGLILAAFLTRDRRESRVGAGAAGCAARWQPVMTSHRDTETPSAEKGFIAASVYDRGMIRIHPFLFVALLASAPAGAQTTAEIDAYYPDLQTLYQDIHRNPELAFQEVQTAAKLAARLKALGYEVTTGVGRTGIVGAVEERRRPDGDAADRARRAAGGGEDRRCRSRAPWSTKNHAGATVPVMHACGHDLHMTAWSGTAKWMAEHRQQWHGTLMLVGQPAEESNGGADGDAEGRSLHALPEARLSSSACMTTTRCLPGTIGFHAGPFRAISISPTITIYGRGGHGAMPHNTIDPIVMAARTVMALQTIVSRENNPMDPVVLTIGSIHGGTQANVIPDEVTLEPEHPHLQRRDAEARARRRHAHREGGSRGGRRHARADDHDARSRATSSSTIPH